MQIFSKKIMLFLLLILFSLPNSTQAAWNVWIEPMLADKPQPSYNPIAKPTTINLKGGKNEWVGFLVCVRGDESLTGFVPTIPSSLTSGENTIADSNLIPYILFNHTTDERANAYEVPGTYPDAAVPYRDVYFNEVRDSAEAGWGQLVEANTTRTFFVEIYIPSDTAVGQYTGSFRLTSNGGALIQNIPITLDVWNFSLPEQWSLKNYWGMMGAYWAMDGTAFGTRDDIKAREYLFNMQKAAINHGFFLYGATARQTSGPTSAGDFTNPYFDGANDQYSWKRFLDGTVSQGYNPKPYPKTSIWATSDEQGNALILKDTANMDLWANWITSHNYDQHTLFFSKIVDEPSMATINSKHDEHVIRHAGYPNRPGEFYTAGAASYPPDSVFWNDEFKSIWMISQFYTWYRAHDWGTAYGSPADFDERRATYGDLLFSYTAGDNDSSCDRDLSYNVGKNCRSAVSESIDAYSRQNAYMLISDWHWTTEGHHNWTGNVGWNQYVETGNSDGDGNFSIPINQTIRDGVCQINAYYIGVDGNTTVRLVGENQNISYLSGVSILNLPATKGATVGPNLTVTGTAIPNVVVKVMTYCGLLDGADYIWETTDPFSDYKMAMQNWGLASSSGYNGDGMYFYPGRVSGTNHDIGGTHEIPIESYRLKLIRWGAQVYEYAKLLETAGQKELADTQVDSLITYNIPNTITVNPVSVWDSARETMGQSIVNGTCSDSIQNQDETGIDCGGVCGACDVIAPSRPSGMNIE